MSDNRRVFADSVVGSEDFLFMQGLSQALYFRLCMTADDKGVVNNARTLVRSIGAGEEHLQELVDLDFVIQIQDKPSLYVIKDWFVMNNPEKYKGKESDFTNEIDAAVFIDECKKYRRLEDAGKYKPYQNQRSKDRNTEKLANTKTVFEKNSLAQSEFFQKLADGKTVFEKNSPEEKRREEKRKEEKRKETHTTQGDEPAKNVCAGDCVCVDSCDSPDDPPDDLPVDDSLSEYVDTDPPPPDDPHIDDLSPVDDLPPDDPPADDFPDDNTLTPKELTDKAEEIRKKLKTAGLGVPDEISWQMRDFKFALEGKRRLHLSDDEFFGALENYAALLAAKKDKPGAFWWDSQMPVPSLFKGNSPPVMRFLPYAFDLNSFKKGNGGKSSVPVQRGIDQSATYDAKEISERQAAQFAEQDAMHDDAYCDNVDF